MHRSVFLTLAGWSPLVLLSSKPVADRTLVENLIKRWKANEAYTMAVWNAMPDALLEYAPSEQQYTFAQHFIHIGYSNNMYVGILADVETYPDYETLKEAAFFIPRPDPVDLFQPDFFQQREATIIKSIVTDYLRATFDFVCTNLEKLDDGQLSLGVKKTKPWFLAGHSNLDLVLRGESHTAHHRAQAITYLRMNDIRPPGYSKLNLLEVPAN